MLKSKAKVLACALAVCGLVAGLAACGGGGSSSSSTTTASTGGGSNGGETEPSAPRPASFPDYEKQKPKGLKPAKGMKVAIVMGGVEAGAQKSLLEGFEQTGEELGVNQKTYIGKGLANVESQVTAMENAIAGNPEVILLFPGTPSGLNAQVQQARQKGIKVVTDLLPAEQEVDLYVASSIQKQGILAAEEVAKQLKGHGNIFLMMGGAGTVVDTFYREGIEGIFKKYPGLKVVESKDLSEFTAVEGQKATEAAVTSNPEVDAVMTNAVEMSEGVNQALQAAGISGVLITGSEVTSQSQLELIKEGTFAQTSGPFYQSGVVGMEWGVALVEGIKPPGPEIEMEPAIINGENVEAAVNSGAIFEFTAPSVLGCGGEGEDPCL
jgi:ribose transport system substrate-binding protein